MSDCFEDKSIEEMDAILEEKDKKMLKWEEGFALEQLKYETDLNDYVKRSDDVFINDNSNQTKELFLLNNDSREQEIYEETILVEEEID